ncbi:MAG: YraN family protein [Tannerella sp.]|jgi:putative endonuclease|nr:YraN family protein [Tannerella sp.]
MAAHNELGKRGEAFAKQYLTDKGYKILETNWRSGHWEIDIIAEKHDLLSVIEVKTRATNDFGYPEEFINKRKMENLLKAAEVYLEQSDKWQGARFEVIALTQNGDTFDVEHFEDAFDAGSVNR